MRLYLADFIERNNMTAMYFFRMAHYKIFGRECDGLEDAKIFLSCGEIPPYAIKFITQLQEKEVENAV